MGRYRIINRFSPNDSNTICDVTGFKRKKSEVIKRWDGFYTVSEAWHPRQPQDNPAIPTPQKTYENIRTQADTTDTVDSFDPI